jgi:hypothetical protein
MKTRIVVLLAALLALIFVTATDAADGPPAETVRVIANAEGKKYCSAVVVAPDHALTARHCISYGMRVDGVDVAYVTAPLVQHEDAALIAAPGLECPCAFIGELPAPGDTVVAIGFPGALDGKQHVTESAKVRAVLRLREFAPWAQGPLAAGTFIFTDKPILLAGDSGGGLFALQDGQWVLIGINSIGVPKDATSTDEQASGFVPVDVAARYL